MNTFLAEADSLFDLRIEKIATSGESTYSIKMEIRGTGFPQGDSEIYGV